MARHVFGAALLLICLLALSGVAAAQEGVEPPPVPTRAELEKRLEETPVSQETWLFWRDRYEAWWFDRTSAIRPLEKALRTFIAQAVQPGAPALPEWLAEDRTAWLLLAESYLREDSSKTGQVEPVLSEMAARRSLELDGNFGPGHSTLAAALILRGIDLNDAMNAAEAARLLNEAEREIEVARSLNPEFGPAFHRGMLAMARKQYFAAEPLFLAAMQDYPNSENAAIAYLQAMFAQPGRTGTWSDLSAAQVKRFPDHGELRLLHGVALMHDRDPQAASAQFALAKAHGANPEMHLSPEMLARVERLAQIMTPELRQALQDLESGQYAAARQSFERALQTQPASAEIALWLAQSLVAGQSPDDAGSAVANELEELCARFPDAGGLHTLRAVALTRAGEYGQAVAALDRAEALGDDPSEIIGAEAVAKIREAGEPGLLGRFLWAMGYFGIAYAVAMAVMAGTGAALSAVTPRVPEPTPEGEGALISRRESLLARLYMLSLGIGLLLFYVSIPFVVAGLLAMTGGVLLLLFMAPVISVKLVILVVIIGLGMGGAVLKSIFASAGGGAFGVKKTADECPRLHAALREVAEKTSTNAIDEVYIAPGSAIGVHQQGRGPFGIFGVKSRVLTLGLSTMHCLTVSELKAILAHEYAHFSHRDTFYSRFIHQVTLSIENALLGMAQYGGSLNYVNPFYWFFWLYYRSYMLLASGFSRSREFLADRMAVRLYGKQAFISGLTKVATDGAFFEASIYQNISALLSQGKAFVNMYEAFRHHCDQELSPDDRQKLYEQVLTQKPSLFDSHPTYRERVQATSGYPDVPATEQETALTLFDDADALEREMTQYLTGFLYLQYQQAAAQD